MLTPHWRDRKRPHMERDSFDPPDIAAALPEKMTAAFAEDARRQWSTSLPGFRAAIDERCRVIQAESEERLENLRADLSEVERRIEELRACESDQNALRLQLTENPRREDLTEQIELVHGLATSEPVHSNGSLRSLRMSSFHRTASIFRPACR